MISRYTFFSADEGLALCDKIIYRTADAGKTWYEWSQLPERRWPDSTKIEGRNHFGEWQWDAKRQGYIADYLSGIDTEGKGQFKQGLLLITSDEGLSWLPYPLEDSVLNWLALESGSLEPPSIHVTDEKIVLGHEAQFNQYRAATSLDNGKTWSFGQLDRGSSRRAILQDGYEYGGSLTGTAHVTFLHNYRGTEYTLSSLFVTKDAWMTHTEFISPFCGGQNELPDRLDFHIPDDSNIFGIHEGHIYRSIDDGRSWKLVFQDSSMPLSTPVTFQDEYWILGGTWSQLANQGEIVRSMDRGATWFVDGGLTPPEPTRWLQTSLDSSGLFAIGQGALYRWKSPSAVSKLQRAQEANVYPNPTTSLIRIQGLQGPWKIYDPLGRLVLNGSSERIDVSGLRQGMYILDTGRLQARFTKL